MSATVTEIATGHNTSAVTSVTSPAVSGAPQVGDLVVVMATDFGGNALASTDVTDLAGNTYTLLRGGAYGGGPARSGIWYTVVTNAFTSGTTTVKFQTAGSSLKIIQVIWVTGCVTVSPADVSNHHDTQSTTTPDTNASGVLAQADELAFALYGYTTAPSFTPPGGWSQSGLSNQVLGQTSQFGLSTAWLETAATTSLNPACTLGSSVTCGGIIGTFKVAAGQPFTPVQVSLGLRRRARRMLRRWRRITQNASVALLTAPANICPGTNSILASRRRPVKPKVRRYRDRSTRAPALHLSPQPAPFHPRTQANTRRRPVARKPFHARHRPGYAFAVNPPPAPPPAGGSGSRYPHAHTTEPRYGAHWARPT